MRHPAIARTPTLSPMLIAAALLWPALGLAQEAPPAVDTSRWTCKFCTFEEGFEFLPSVGVGYVSDDSAKFGEYSDLGEKGAYLIADGDGRYRRKDGLWLDFSAAELGLDSRSFSAEGGRQGRYELRFDYRTLPHHIGDSASTPFAGAGSATLTLPAGWVAAGSTSQMSALAGSAHGIDFRTERERIGLGVRFTPLQHWTFAVDARHEEKTGARATGGTFVFSDARLVMPLRYDTNQFDASAAYHAPKFQARIAYYASIFRNDDAALTWDNPYLPLNAGAERGRLALAPDNQFHQLTLTGAYQVAANTQFTGNLSLGRMTQDEAFLPYTINASLATQALPRRSLDGQVDTVNADLKFSSRLTDDLRIVGSVAYQERNNQTPSATYQAITTDVGFAIPRSNLPYSFTRSAARIEGTYDLAPGARLQAGCSTETFHRDLQEVRSSRERGCWGKAALSTSEYFDFSLQWKHLERAVSDYLANRQDLPPQNPLMRLFNMADRVREEGRVRIDITPGERFSFGLDAGGTWDDYYLTQIGLRDGRSWSAAADCTWSLAKRLTATCYASHEQVRARLVNAELLSTTLQWTGENTDTTETAGAGLTFEASEKLRMGLDYTYVRSVGEIRISDAVVGFPDLETKLDSAQLYIDFSPRAKLALRLSYRHEKFRSDDWALDGVLPDTIVNVLGFGELSPVYDVDWVALTGRYQF